MKKFSELSEIEVKRAEAIHKKSIFINGLDCSWLQYIDDKYFQDQKDGGVTGVNMTVNLGWDGFYESIMKIGKWYKRLDTYSDRAFQATTIEDIYKAKREGKLAIIFGFQNTKPFEEDLDTLTLFYKLGIRIAGIAYQTRNVVGDGCEERTDCGLSKFGVKVVEEMNRLGIVIDLSHTGRKTSLETIEVSKDPVIFSHSGVRSLVDNVRNLYDEQIKAMAEKRGVLGIVAFSPYLNAKKRPNLDDYLNHMEYAIKVVGVDHVGIGIDWGGPAQWDAFKSKYPETVGDVHTLETAWPEGLDKASKWINITRGLVARGYSDQEIEKILGGNFLKVFKRVW